MKAESTPDPSLEDILKEKGIPDEVIAIILRKHAKDIAEARIDERDICRRAVAREWAPITGTPYIAGSRRFVLAIDALPEIRKP